jgi:hypothetical protein
MHCAATAAPSTDMVSGTCSASWYGSLTEPATKVQPTNDHLLEFTAPPVSTG